MVQPVRGTHDLLPAQMAHYQLIVDHARDVLACFGMREMATPIFEFTDVFFHVGETSDIVTKEAYTFLDRGGDSLTLRPEGTAAAVRAVISNGLTQNLPLKYMYAGPMFRYDRPQKGRYRQFHQIGAEIFGQEGPVADAECIASAYAFLKALNLHEKCVLKINTLGDWESRTLHREKLVAYFSRVKTQLSPESQVRLEKNPLRILDSKDPKDQAFLPDAPKLHECLTEGARAHFDAVCKLLTQAEIPFDINPLIVRGLDYYVHTTFEFVMDENLAQGTVLGGGRYDGLFKTMGGPDISGVGWACGVERIMLLHEFDDEPLPPIALIGLGEEVQETLWKLSHQLREQGFYVEMIFGNNPAKLFKKADKLNAWGALVMGTDELAAQCVTFKIFEDGTQSSVPLDRILDVLTSEGVN